METIRKKIIVYYKDYTRCLKNKSQNCTYMYLHDPNLNVNALCLPWNFLFKFIPISLSLASGITKRGENIKNKNILILLVCHNE